MHGQQAYTQNGKPTCYEVSPLERLICFFGPGTICLYDLRSLPYVKVAFAVSLQAGIDLMTPP